VANGINYWGDTVVGTEQLNSSNERAFVWELNPGGSPSYTAVDLMSLIPANSNWDLTEATGINAFYSICGWGFRMVNGLPQKRGFILIPVHLDTLLLDPNSVTGGNTVVAHATLSNITSSDVLMSFSSSSSIAVPDPMAIVKQGTKTTSFNIATHGVLAPAHVQITSSFGGWNSNGALTVNPAAPTSISTPASVLAGTNFVANANFNGFAAVGGKVTWSSNNAVITAPGPTTVTSEGKTVAGTFTVNTPTVATTVTISATYLGVSAKKTLVIQP
jgi:hypothetical protein